MASKNRNSFAFWTTISAVAIIAVIVVVVIWINSAATDVGPKPVASGTPTAATAPISVNIDDGSVDFGNGPDVVQVYLDFQCPFCKDFETNEGAVIQKLVDDGKITLRVHPIAILDRFSTTEYSSRAANAYWAVAGADPDHLTAFMQALYANQPPENSAGLTDEQIIDIARGAGVNVTPELEKEITSQKFIRYARSLGLPDGANGTPSLVINDKLIPVQYDANLDILPNLSK